MSVFKTFVVAGAGGLGKFIVEELLKLQKEGKISSISFLTRSEGANEELVAKGAKRIVVNYDDLASLSSALSGVDVIVSTLHVDAAGVTSQGNLAEASKQAGVKLFVPSEFGNPTEGRNDNPVYAGKNIVKQGLKDLGLPYTAFYTGPFADQLIASDFAKLFGFDFRAGKVDVKGEGNEPISLTSRADVASYLGYVLTSLPKEKLEWRIFRIEGDRISLNGIISAFESRTGKHIAVSHTPRSELEQALKENPADFVSFLALQFDLGRGVVGTPEQVDNKEYPGWNPKKVVDLLVEYVQ